jgi:urease gamma subunit
MKLLDLESSSVQKSQKVFESYFEKKMDLSAIDQAQALEMLEKVRSTINEYRNSTSFHTSESNPKYLRAIFMEQALMNVLSEAPPPPGIVRQVDPSAQETKNAIEKARKGLNLSPNEQAIISAIATQALGRTEGKKYKKGKKLQESEIQQAQVVLAAQDMVDRVQDMIEDITDMEYKDLPALVESIKNEVGTSQAQQFRDQATTALEGLVGNLQNAKQQLESAQGILTGQEPVVPGEMDMDMDMDMDVDTDAGDIEVDADADVEEPESDLEASLGRARR